MRYTNPRLLYFTLLYFTLLLNSEHSQEHLPQQLNGTCFNPLMLYRDLGSGSHFWNPGALRQTAAPCLLYTVLERRLLTSELSLSCARPSADHLRG